MAGVGDSGSGDAPVLWKCIRILISFLCSGLRGGRYTERAGAKFYPALICSTCTMTLKCVSIWNDFKNYMHVHKRCMHENIDTI